MKRSTDKLLSFAAATSFALALLIITSHNAAAQQPTNTFPDNGNAGVGTTVPTYKLEVNGNGGTVGDSLLVTDSNTTTTALDIANTSSGARKWRLQSVGSSVSGRVGNFELVEVGSNLKAFVVQPGGNIGIGTTSPGYPLTVNQTGNSVNRLLSLANDSSGSSAQSVLSFFEGTTEKFKFGMNGSGATGYVGGANAFLLWHFQNAPIAFGTNSTERVRIDGSGNVGIGTSSPGALLDLKGTNAPYIGQLRIAASDYGQITFYDSTNLTGNATNRRSNIFHDVAAGTFNIGSNGNILLYPTNHVGIGTTSPVYSLDVNGGSNAFRAKASTANSNDTIATFENSSGIVGIVRANGNVGLGTISPLGPIDVRISNGSTSGLLVNYNANNNTYLRAGSTSADIHIGDITTRNVLLLESGGNVGIGTSPGSQYKLDVAGNINSSATITGNSITAKYQDVAEWVPASEQLSAGTVVVLDSTKSNQVISSSQSYDTRVAGVISAQPGITLGESGTGKVLVATTGRVRVKVDATRAPIRIGDLLVTSDVPGLAMKSEAVNLGGVQLHRPGTLIGKALEPMEKGSGTILVLLSLQ